MKTKSFIPDEFLQFQASSVMPTNHKQDNQSFNQYR